MTDKEKDRLDEYLEKDSKILDKSYLDTENESKYLDKFNKTDDKTRISYLDRLNDPELKHEKSYLDRLNDPESEAGKSYLETITFNYLNQDTAIKDIKIDYGYFTKDKKPEEPVEKTEVTPKEEPAEQQDYLEENQTAAEEIPDEPVETPEPPAIDESKVLDHVPQLPRTIWYLAEGSQSIHSGVKSFSQWQAESFRGTGKLRKVWSTTFETDPGQVWPIITLNNWFVGPFAKIDPATGTTKFLKKPLIPEITDGYKIFGAMKFDDMWWRVAIDLDSSAFSGKFNPAEKPRGSFKNIGRNLLYLDARTDEKPSVSRLNPEDCSVLWKLETNGSMGIVNANIAFDSLWVIQQATGNAIMTQIDPLKGTALDFTLAGRNPCDCLDFWGKLFVTTSNGLLLEYSQNGVTREMTIGNDGWTTTVIHAFEDRVFLKSTDGKQNEFYSIDPLSGDWKTLKVMPRKDGSYFFPDGRYFRKMNLKTNETIWFIDDQYITSVLLEDERGVLTKSGLTVTLWA